MKDPSRVPFPEPARCESPSVEGSAAEGEERQLILEPVSRHLPRHTAGGAGSAGGAGGAGGAASGSAMAPGTTRNAQMSPTAQTQHLTCGTNSSQGPLQFGHFVPTTLEGTLNARFELSSSLVVLWSGMRGSAISFGGTEPRFFNSFGFTPLWPSVKGHYVWACKEQSNMLDQ